MRIFFVIFLLFNISIFLGFPYIWYLGVLLEYIFPGDSCIMVLIRITMTMNLLIIHIGIIGYIIIKYEDKLNNWLEGK